MKRLGTLLSCTALAAALTFAQGFGAGQGRGPAGGGAALNPVEMRVNMLARFLNLTDEQKAKATEIYTASHEAQAETRTLMQTARESMAAAVKTNNTAAIDQAARDIGEATARAAAIEGKADAAFYALLTAEQKEKFNSMPRRGPMGGMPEGMPGPGPAGMRRGR
jgi:Spy/CpxP family protein refolding chaperone